MANYLKKRLAFTNLEPLKIFFEAKHFPFLPRKKNLSSAICPIRFGGGLLIGVEGVEGFLGVECGGARIAFGFL